MKEPHLIFPPNPHGPLTVPNAVVMMACAEECIERKLAASIMVRVDMAPTYAAPGFSTPYSQTEEMTGSGWMATVKALVLPHNHVGYFGTVLGEWGLWREARLTLQTARMPRYWEVLDMLLKRKLAVQTGPGCYHLAGSGPEEYFRRIVRGYRFMHEFTVVCDIFDWNVPVIVRGRDLEILSKGERLIFPFVSEVLEKRMLPAYRYIPLMYGEGEGVPGEIISKHVNRPGWHYINWCERFETPQDVAAALHALAEPHDGTIVLRDDGTAYRHPGGEEVDYRNYEERKAGVPCAWESGKLEQGKGVYG